MLRAQDVLAVVERDVRTALENVFTPTDGYQLLHTGGFEFDDGHVPEAEVSFVAWSYRGVHDRTLLCKEGVRADGTAMPIIDPNPPSQPDPSTLTPGLAPTGRPVDVVGTTIVVSRTPEEEKEPTLLRFIDWACVFGQLGYVYDYARVVE